MERGDSAIREAFVKIKQDMDGHSDKLSKLFSKSKRIDSFMSEIKKDFLDLKQSLETIDKKTKRKATTRQRIPEIDELKKNIKLVTNSYELYRELKKDIELLKKEIALKDQSYKEEIKKLIKEFIGEAKRPSLKTKIIQGFDRNKKRIITKKILDLIAEKQLMLPELKTAVVDELGYCSKASFYRYFEELKKRRLIDFIEFEGTKTLVLVKEKLKPR